MKTFIFLRMTNKTTYKEKLTLNQMFSKEKLKYHLEDRQTLLSTHLASQVAN